DSAGLKAYLEDTSSSDYNEYKNDFHDIFKKGIEKGEKAGVDWSQAELVSYTADSIIEKEEKVWVSELKGRIYFNVNEKSFFLDYKNVTWMDRGWYGATISRVDKKGNEDAPCDGCDNVHEITSENTQPVKKTTPKKPATAPAKKKPTSPAHKP